MPEPACGLLVISTNAIAYLNHNFSLVLATNSYASVTVDSSKYRVIRNPEENPLDLALDSCKLCFVSPTLALLALKDGELYTVRLHISAGAVASLSVVPESFSAGITSCFAAHRDRDETLLFQGSRLSDSLLMSMTLTHAQSAADAAEPAPNATDALDELDELYAASTPAAAAPVAPTVPSTLLSGDDEFDELYASAPSSGVAQSSRIEVAFVDDSQSELVTTVIDAIPCLGPVTDALLGLASRSEQEAADVRVARVPLPHCALNPCCARLCALCSFR